MTPIALLLVDNLYFGSGFSCLLTQASAREEGATVFACRVANQRLMGFSTRSPSSFTEEKSQQQKNRFVRLPVLGN